MAESHVVTALVTKRSEMAGLIEHHKKDCLLYTSRCV